METGADLRSRVYPGFIQLTKFIAMNLEKPPSTSSSSIWCWETRTRPARSRRSTRSISPHSTCLERMMGSAADLIEMQTRRQAIPSGPLLRSNAVRMRLSLAAWPDAIFAERPPS